MNQAELLTGLLRELEAIDRLISRGRAAWEADELLRLSIERRWINAGNYAESYRVAAGLPATMDPWTELYDYRCFLAHALPELLDPERIWHDTVVDIGRLREAVARQWAEESQ